MLTVNQHIDGGNCTFGVSVYHDRSSKIAALSISRYIHGMGYDKGFEIRETHHDLKIAEKRAGLFLQAITQMGNNIQLTDLVSYCPESRERELVLC